MRCPEYVPRVIHSLNDVDTARHTVARHYSNSHYLHNTRDVDVDVTCMDIHCISSYLDGRSVVYLVMSVAHRADVLVTRLHSVWDGAGQRWCCSATRRKD